MGCLASSEFSVKKMATVIECVQTAPASAHQNTIQEYSNLFLFFFSLVGWKGCIHRLYSLWLLLIYTKYFWPITNETERGQIMASLVLVPLFCVHYGVAAFWGRVEKYFFDGSRRPTLENVLFLLQYLLKIKVYLSVKRQRFTVIQMTT